MESKSSICFTCSQNIIAESSSPQSFCLKQMCRILKLPLSILSEFDYLNQEFESESKIKTAVCDACHELLNHAEIIQKEIENLETELVTFTDKIKNIMTTNFSTIGENSTESTDPSYSIKKSFVQCWEGWSVQVINLEDLEENLEDNDPAQIAQKVYFGYLNPDDVDNERFGANVRLNSEDKHSVPVVVRDDQDSYFETKVSIATVHLPTGENHQNTSNSVCFNAVSSDNLELFPNPLISAKITNENDGCERKRPTKRCFNENDRDECNQSQTIGKKSTTQGNKNINKNIETSKANNVDNSSNNNSDSNVEENPNCDDSSSSSIQSSQPAPHVLSNRKRRQTIQENSPDETKRRKQASVVKMDDGQKFVYDGEYYFTEVENGFQCCHCEIIKPTRKVIVAHMRHHRIKGSMKFSCKTCSKSFVSQRDLAGHEKSCPTLQVKTAVVQVDEGKFCYGDKWYFDRTETEKGDFKFICCSCGIVKSTQRNMTMHLRSHRVADSKQFTCNICGLARVTQRDLDKHQKACANPKRIVEIEPGVFLYEGKWRYEAIEYGFKCCTCGGVRVNKPSMMLHLRRHRGKESKQHVCQPCGRSFAFKQELLTHQLNHSEAKRRTTSVKYAEKKFLYGGKWRYEQLPDGDFQCEACSITTKTRKKMTLHLLRNHADPQRYVCDKCGASFGSSSVFKSHQSTHTSVRPFQCHICGKTYKTQSQLCSHKHTHEIWQCELCDKKLYSKFLLREHTLAHSGIKGYKCSRCGREFQHRKGLTNHWKKHNEATDFHCNESQCHMTFLQKREVTKHVRTAHGDEGSSQVDMCTTIVDVVEIMPSIEEVVLIEECSMEKESPHSLTESETELKSSEEEEEDESQYQQQLTIAFNS